VGDTNISKEFVATIFRTLCRCVG